MTSQMIEIDGHMIRPQDVSTVTRISHHTTKNHWGTYLESVGSGFTIHLVGSANGIYIGRLKYLGRAAELGGDYTTQYRKLDAEVKPLRDKLLEAIEQNPRAAVANTA